MTDSPQLPEIPETVRARRLARRMSEPNGANPVSSS
jgi:hypothetical protein